MKALVFLALAIALVGAFPTFAADTSVTEVYRKAQVPVGVTPVVGTIKATLTSGAASASKATIDVPPKAGRVIRSWIANVRDVNGAVKSPSVLLSGTTFIVSGTISQSDTVTIHTTYQP